MAGNLRDKNEEVFLSKRRWGSAKGSPVKPLES